MGNQNLNNLLQSLRGLSSKQYSFGLPTLLLAGLLLAGSFYWGVHSVGALNQKLNEVQARELDYRVKVEKSEAQHQEDLKFITGLESRQKVLETRMEAGRKMFNAEVANMRAAKTPEQVQKNAEEYLAVKPEIVNGNLSFTPVQVTEFIVTGMDRDRLQSELNNVMERYRLEQQKSAALQAGLDRERGLRLDAEKLMQDYKKIVKKSKFKRFLGGVVKFGTISGAFVLGVLVAG